MEPRTKATEASESKRTTNHSLSRYIQMRSSGASQVVRLLSLASLAVVRGSIRPLPSLDQA